MDMKTIPSMIWLLAVIAMRIFMARNHGVCDAIRLDVAFIEFDN